MVGRVLRTACGALEGVLCTVTDNVWLQAAMACLLAAAVLTALRRGRYWYGPADWVLPVCMGYTAAHLPTLSGRLYTALSTVAGIILQSDTYTDAFRDATGSGASTAKGVAEALYRSVPTGTEPEELYTHLASTIGKVRHFPILGNADAGVPPAAAVAVLAICILLGAAAMRSRGTCSRAGWALFAVRAAALACPAGVNRLALFTAATSWVAEVALVYLFGGGADTGQDT